MAYKINPDTGKAIRGFAAMSLEKRTEISRQGGTNIPSHKRSFFRDRGLASTAGAKGGAASNGGGRRPATALAGE